MNGRKALERWETERENCEVTPQAICPIEKSLIKKDNPKDTNCYSWSFRS
jgi:hypothetical protein